MLGLTQLDPDQLVPQLLGLPAGFVGVGLTAGSYLVAGILFGLLLGGLFAYRTAWFRRYVGVLWDLGTFWPRAAHPFAPPSYADRAVPELAARITHLAERHAGVLLCGHSHGSVLLAIAVLRLPPRVRSRVALLTYASPLDRLYARLFPAYLGEDVLRAGGGAGRVAVAEPVAGHGPGRRLDVRRAPARRPAPGHCGPRRPGGPAAAGPAGGGAAAGGAPAATGAGAPDGRVRPGVRGGGAGTRRTTPRRPGRLRG